MAERRPLGYDVHREILDEETVEKMAQKSESKTSVREKLGKAAR